jgi:hypothetical protein
MPTGKWEVATDLLWLIDKNQFPPSVFVRKHGGNGAWRGRLGGNFASRKDFVSSPQLKVTQEYLLILGREWHLSESNKRVVPYLGVDLPIRYHLERERTDIRTSGQTFINNSFVSDISIGVAGLFGLRYQLSSHLSLSVEANCQANYQRQKWFNRHNIYPNDTVYDRQLIDLQLIPLQTINLSYHF